MAQFLLPQNDPARNRAARVAQGLADCPLLFDKEFPRSSVTPAYAAAPAAYGVEALKSLFKRRSSIQTIKSDSGFTFSRDLPQTPLGNLVNMMRQGQIGKLNDYYAPDLGPVLPSGRPRVIHDYDRLFIKDAIPELAQTIDGSDSVQNDAFTHTFLAGSDPYSLQQVNQIPGKFPFSERHFQTIPQAPGDSLAAALRAGRVYMLDYEALGALENGHHPQQPKYIYAPMAAFAVHQTTGSLRPFAIQTGQNPSGREIYTPLDAWSWKIARGIVQAAANTLSVTVHHLCHTHLVCEAFALATYRHLATNHPVRGLLLPHFVNTLDINRGAFESLINADQFVDRIVGSSYPSTMKLVQHVRLQFDFKANYFPEKFRRRGTLNAATLPNYPVRDDGLLLWQAIETWVTDYVYAYYRDEQALLQDQEIAAWAREIGSSDVGKIKNFGRGDGTLGSRADLISSLTMIIFTAGPSHAIVNFAQRTDMAYQPTSPLAGYIPEITGKGHTEQNWVDFLGPIDVALVQQSFFLLLGSVYYSKLGQYGDLFNKPDPGIKDALARFQANLADIEAKIAARNKMRKPYEHLLPSRIPQSVNI